LGREVVKLCVSEACQGHGRCYTLAPQLLSKDDEVDVPIRGGEPIDVPDDLRELAGEVEEAPVRRARSA